MLVVDQQCRCVCVCVACLLWAGAHICVPACTRRQAWARLDDPRLEECMRRHIHTRTFFLAATRARAVRWLRRTRPWPRGTRSGAAGGVQHGRRGGHRPSWPAGGEPVRQAQRGMEAATGGWRGSHSIGKLGRCSSRLVRSWLLRPLLRWGQPYSVYLEPGHGPTSRPFQLGLQLGGCSGHR